MRWTVTLLPAAEAELHALPADMIARFRWIAALIQEHGLERAREPHVKHLDGPLWEIRMTGRDGIARAIYVTAAGKEVVVVRVFVKKTKKTPGKELELARQRAKEIE
jgi:phage-related protein